MFCRWKTSFLFWKITLSTQNSDRERSKTVQTYNGSRVLLNFCWGVPRFYMKKKKKNTNLKIWIFPLSSAAFKEMLAIVISSDWKTVSLIFAFIGVVHLILEDYCIYIECAATTHRTPTNLIGRKSQIKNKCILFYFFRGCHATNNESMEFYRKSTRSP